MAQKCILLNALSKDTQRIEQKSLFTTRSREGGGHD